MKNKIVKALFGAMLATSLSLPALADQAAYMTLNHNQSGGITPLSGPANSVAAMDTTGAEVEFKAVSGTGGITVTPGANTLVIGSSGLQGPGFVSNVVAGSTQTGAVGNAYIMTGATPTFTLPTAVGAGGKQILVINGTASSTTITYAATASQTTNGAATSGKSNATGWSEDLFTSDGTNWKAAHLTGL